MKCRVTFAVFVLLVTGIAAGAPGGASGRAASEGIVLRLVDGAGRVTTVLVSSAGSVTMTNPGLEPLRLRPVRDQGLLYVEASVGGGESAAGASMTTPLLAPGDAAHIDLAGYVVDVRWLGTAPVPDASVTIAGDGSDSECCLVCDGIKTCACRVQASCGSCCAPACGGCAAIADK